jgi:hypothetical protein
MLEDGLPTEVFNNITLWLFNIAMENGPFIDDFPINTSIYKGFSMAMLNNQMVEKKNRILGLFQFLTNPDSQCFPRHIHPPKHPTW